MMRSDAYIAGYLAGLAGRQKDPILLMAAYRIDPERIEWHNTVWTIMSQNEPLPDLTPPPMA